MTFQGASPIGIGQDHLVNSTHERIVALIPGIKKGDQVSDKIKAVLEEAFQDATEAEALLDLKDKFIDELTRTNDDLNIRIAAVEKKHDLNKGEIDRLQAETAQLTRDLSLLKAENKAAEQRYLALQKSTDRLKDDSADLHRKYLDLEEEFKTLSRCEAALKSKAGSLEAKMKDLRSDYDTLKDDHAKLQKEAEDLVSTSTSLEEDYESLKKETGQLRSRYTQLQQDYKSLENIVKAALNGTHLKNQQASFSGIWKYLGTGLYHAAPYPLQIIINGVYQ